MVRFVYFAMNNVIGFLRINHLSFILCLLYVFLQVINIGMKGFRIRKNYLLEFFGGCR